MRVGWLHEVEAQIMPMMLVSSSDHPCMGWHVLLWHQEKLTEIFMKAAVKPTCLSSRLCIASAYQPHILYRVTAPEHSHHTGDSVPSVILCNGDFSECLSVGPCPYNTTCWDLYREFHGTRCCSKVGLDDDDDDDIFQQSCIAWISIKKRNLNITYW